jgi:hypothetical protein
MIDQFNTIRFCRNSLSEKEKKRAALHLKELYLNLRKKDAIVFLPRKYSLRSITLDMIAV